MSTYVLGGRWGPERGLPGRSHAASDGGGSLKEWRDYEAVDKRRSLSRPPSEFEFPKFERRQSLIQGQTETAPLSPSLLSLALPDPPGTSFEGGLVHPPISATNLISGGRCLRTPEGFPSCVSTTIYPVWAAQDVQSPGSMAPIRGLPRQ